jgi:hypothetical protein
VWLYWFNSRLQNRLSWADFSWFSSVIRSECWDNTVKYATIASSHSLQLTFHNCPLLS